MLTVNEAFELLKKEKITDSVQMLRRWLRQGVLKGHPSENRKDGWRIAKKELEQFIATRTPAPAKELIALREQNKNLQAKLEILQLENKELKQQLANVTQGNITGGNIIRELNNQELAMLWQEAVKNLKTEPDILEGAYQSLVKEILDKNTSMTKLYDHKFKRPYVCPFTNKKFSNPERLIASAIPWLIRAKQLEKKRKKERDEQEEYQKKMLAFAK